MTLEEWVKSAPKVTIQMDRFATDEELLDLFSDLARAVGVRARRLMIVGVDADDAAAIIGGEAVFGDPIPLGYTILRTSSHYWFDRNLVAILVEHPSFPLVACGSVVTECFDVPVIRCEPAPDAIVEAK